MAKEWPYGKRPRVRPSPLGAIKPTEDLTKLSLWQLVYVYEREHHCWSERVAAEAAFALALAIKREADRMCEGFKDEKEKYTALAKRYAQECLGHLKHLPSAELPDVTTSYSSLVGVGMPNYFYADYITNKRFFPAFAALLE